MTLLATLGRGARAGRRAACSAAWHAQGPPPCSAACHAQGPPPCSAACHAQDPSPCSATCHAQDLLPCSAACHAQDPSPCSATCHAQDLPPCSAACHAQDPPPCSTAWHTQDPPPCSTAWHAQDPSPCSATCHAQDLLPCRARAPSTRTGMRLVCCAPPPGTPPPCPPPPPSCPLTCQNARAVCDQNCVPSNEACLAHSPEELLGFSYCCDQDAVAQRLEQARGVRRAHYARSQAWRAAACPAPCPCPAPYALRGERPCARATDGCTYAVVREHAAPARCGPCRAPPPPRCVELAPDDACRIRSHAHVDPCAYRPRVMLDIDRSCCAPHACPSCASAPPCCRQPTVAELFRARSLACQSNRHTHTSAALFKTATPVCGGIHDVLRSKEQLKEAGVGRMMTETGAGGARPGEALGGKLELRVPAGAARVRVHVALAGPEPGSTTTSCPVLSANLDTTSIKQNPCLHTNKIPKKLNYLADPKADAQSAGPGYPGPCSPCGPPTPPRCKPPLVKSPNDVQLGTKRCSSTAAFLTNTSI